MRSRVVKSKIGCKHQNTQSPELLLRVRMLQSLPHANCHCALPPGIACLRGGRPGARNFRCLLCDTQPGAVPAGNGRRPYPLAAVQELGFTGRGARACRNGPGGAPGPPVGANKLPWGTGSESGAAANPPAISTPLDANWAAAWSGAGAGCVPPI